MLPLDEISIKSDAEALRLKLNQETARIHWVDLQRWFAAGRVIQVRPGVDLIEVAVWLALDLADRLEEEIARQRVAPVSDQQARDWLASGATLWALVVKPWVLVQEEAV